MKHYVLGFYFSPAGVLLIEKSKPEWQRGLCNGLGGSIERFETPQEAMVREFHEEAGIETQEMDWRRVIRIVSSEWVLHVFKSNGAETAVWPECDEGKLAFYLHPPANMEVTAHWLYWLCRNDSISGVEFAGHYEPAGTE